MPNLAALRLPLRFRPVYHELVWGGRRLAAWRPDLPAGPIGESWEIADHARGMSVVAEGEMAGTSLQQLTAEAGDDLVGRGFPGGAFPLMVKFIDARDRLSVQVHPDDAQAQALGLGARGKTECWSMIGDGGEVFVGVQTGVDRARFEAARAEGQLASVLVRYPVRDGDFFHLPARTVHALGAGCLVCEVQQTCDLTFRVDDWGRVGLDGKPRPLHLRESLATIAFTPDRGGSRTAPGESRTLVACPYFTVEELRAATAQRPANGRCVLVMSLGGPGTVATAAGRVALPALSSILIPAASGAWSYAAEPGSEPRLLVASPAW
jgi:mannose-6-phosphate isomerase